MYCFFFMQKTAYEMRISDWSSDVCSSELLPLLGGVIFGIFRKITMRARFLDRLDDFRPFRLQVPQLSRKHFMPLSQHRHLFNRRHVAFLLSKIPRSGPLPCRAAAA